MATMALVLPNDIEQVLVGGDLSRLNPQQRVTFYGKVCESLGLNPLTKPFEYITLNGKQVLYARKDCTDQLRTVHNVSIQIVSRECIEGVYVVTARAINAHGRQDESLGAVPIDGLKGEARANAMMKAETKAKRRVTLSVCGLGMLDESETDLIPGAKFTQEETADRRIAEETRKSAPPAEPEDAELTELLGKLSGQRANDDSIMGTLCNQIDEVLDGEGTASWERALNKFGDPALLKNGKSLEATKQIVRYLHGILKGAKAHA